MYNLQINELTPGQKYYVKVRAKAPGYATSEWSPAFEFEAEQDQIPPERVRNLTFTSEGDSFIARWEAPELNMDGTPCTDLSHYKITLVNFDASRTVHLETSNPEFTIDFNSNKQLFGTPSGIIEITVSAVDRVSNVGPGSSKIAQNMPPAKVNNVTAQSSVETVTLKWDPSVETDIEKYNVYVSNEGPDFAMTQATLAGSVAFGTNTFAHTTMSLSPLYFKVTAVDKFLQQSPASNVAMAQPKLTTDFDKTPPGAVTNFTAVQSLAPDNSTAIARLSFTAAADNDLDKYEVQYRKTGETTLPWSFLTIPSDQTSAEIKSLPLSTSYDFRIRAVDFLANKGDWSAVVVAPGVKKTTLPAAPTGVTVRGGMSNLMVTWNASTDPSMANWSGTYEVQISKASTFTSPTTIKTSSTLASFINLDQNTVYYVRVRAIDPYENTGAWSSTANGNTGIVADANASRVIWSETEPVDGKTNDLWIKIPDNVQYRFDGTDWIKAQDTELAGEIDNVRQTADGKNKAWYQTTKPPATNNTQGDLWFDTANGNKLHVWSTSANDWVSAQDAAIQDALDDAADALQTADGKNTIYYSTPPATGLKEGDTWFDNSVIKVYKSGAWVDASTALDNAKANQAIQIAGSKNKTYYVAKASATGMIEGDVLFDSADGNKQYRYNGTAWVAVTDAAIAAAQNAAGQAQQTADKKNTIYYSTPPTTGLKDGDTWFDGPTIKTYRNGVWTDSSSNLETQQGSDALQVAGSKNKTYYTTYANRPTTGLTAGDLLFDTGNKYKAYRYSGTAWTSVQDGTIADAQTAADNAQTAANTAITNAQTAFNLADGKAQVFWGGTRPTNLGVDDEGDIWVDVAKTPNEIQVWSGTAWAVTGDPATKAIADAANTLAGAKSYTYIENTAPTSASVPAPTKGDIWIKNNVTPNEVSVYTGSAWVAAGDKTARDSAGAKAHVFTTTNDTAPTSPTPKRGDVWINTTTGKTKIRSTSAWVDSTDPEARTIANSKITTYYNETSPAAPAGGFTTGDLWVRTTDNRLHRWSGAWVELKDKSITDLESLTEDIIDDLIPGLETQLDKKIEVYVQNDAPAITDAAKQKGDIWIRPANGEVKVYSGTAWVVSADPAAKALANTAQTAANNAATAAGDAQTTADKKMQTFYGPSGPANNPVGTLKVNDLWIDSGNKRLHRWNGTIWEEVKDADITAAQQAAATANQAVGNLAGTVGDLTTQVDKKVEVWFQTNQPAVPAAAADRLKMKGDIWINTSTGASNGEVKMYPGAGTVWNVVTDPAAIAAAQTAKDIADSKRQVFGGELAPSNTTGATGNNLQVNDLWIRDSDKKMHRWAGSAWETAQDKAIEAADKRDDNLIPNGSGELLSSEYWNSSALEWHPDGMGNFPGYFVGKSGSQSAAHTEIISINPSETYVFSGWMRNVGTPGFQATSYIRFTAYDVDGFTISRGNHIFKEGTLTTLAEPLAIGDTTFKITGDSSVLDTWEAQQSAQTYHRHIMVHNYVDGTGYQWPVETYTRNSIRSSGAFVSIDKATKTITLNGASDKALPAGTPISIGLFGDTTTLTVISAKTTDEWKFYSRTITGVQQSPYGHSTTSEHPRGGVAYKPVVLFNRGTYDAEKHVPAFAGITISKLAATKELATTALDSANARNRSIFSTGNATGTTLNGYSFINGDMWYRKDANDTIIGMWEFIGGTWIPKTLNNQVIANLDAGKINAGTINADRIGSNSIDASKIVVGGMDGSVVIKDGTITADELAANSVIAGKIATGAVTAEKIKAGEIDATKIVQGGMDGSVVIESGTITATQIKGATITGDKIAGNTIDATSIKAGSIVIGAPNSPLSPTGIATPSTVATAKSEAISTASGDATAKANAAQAAAIQAAATDAQTKANAAKAAAEQAAKDYADGQITQAEAAAIAAAATDAQAKADAARQAAIQAAATDATTKANNAKTAAETAAKGYTDGQVGPINTAVTGINTKLGGWSHPTNTTFIDGGKIYTDSITAGQIAANAIGVSELAANAVTADKIAANSVSAQKLVIGMGENFVNDPKFIADIGVNWTPGPSTSITNEGLNGGRSMKIVNAATQQASYNLPYEGIYVEAGSAFRIVLTVKTSAAAPANSIGLGFRLRRADGTNSFPTAAYIPVQTAALTNYATFDLGIVKVGESGTLSWYLVSQATLSTGTVWFDNVSIMRATGTTMIENDAITTGKIAAQQITGAKIAADTITVGNMGPNSVDRTVIKDGEIITAKLAANAVKAGNIDAGAITAGKIAAGAITIGPTSPIAPGTIANSGEVVPKISGTTGSRVYRDLATYHQGLNGASGALIVRTPITFNNYMTSIKLSGYNYQNSMNNIDLTVSFYATTGSGGAIIQTSLNSTGLLPVEVTICKTNDTTPTVALIIKSKSNTGLWYYPKLNVDEAMIGQSSAPDSFKNGWSISHNATPDTDAEILAWTKVTPSGTGALNQAETVRMAEGWAFTGTTEINGGKIKADTITAAQIKAGSITIGPNAPIAPGIVAIPSDVSTAKTEAINAAASDATTKANNAKTGAENTAKGYTDTTVAPINTTIGNWKYGNTTFINGGSIYTRTIEAESIKADSLTANEIAANAITASELAANSVLAGNIKAGEITGDKLKANTALVNALNIQSSLTINHANGHIKSSNYNANGSAGFYMDQQQLIINQGKIKAAAIELQDSSNIMPPLYASFNANASAYEVAKFWRGSLSGTTKVANDGKFGGGSVQFVITSNTGFVGMGASGTDLNIPIEGGNQYIISFYVSNRSSKAITLQPELYQTSAITIKGTAISIANSTAWVRHSVVVTAPATMTRAILRFNLTAGATATFKLDGIQVEQKTGALNTPSNWSPPGYTSIDGESITTGAISSNSTISTPNGNIARWSIDTAGKARFADATIDGKLVVGADVSNKEATSIQSDQYSAGNAGWAIKGNGDVEFNNGTFRGALILEKVGSQDIGLSMKMSVSNINVHTDTVTSTEVDTANIRGTTYGYTRVLSSSGSGYEPQDIDPYKKGSFFMGPTTERALNLQVHDGPSDQDVYLATPPANITLTSLNLGEQTDSGSEPAFRENQGLRFRTYRNEARDYKLGGQQTGGDANIVLSSYEAVNRERSAVIPEGDALEYPQSKHEWQSSSVYYTPKAKNLFDPLFVAGKYGFTRTTVGNISLGSDVLISGGQFGYGTNGHSVLNTSVTSSTIGFDMNVTIPTAGPHIVSFYVDNPFNVQSNEPTYLAVSENTASFTANNPVDPPKNVAPFGLLGENHVAVYPDAKGQRVSFYIPSLAAGTRIIRMRFLMPPLTIIRFYKPQLELAAYRSDNTLPPEVKNSYEPTPWTPNNIRASASVSLKLSAEPVIDPEEFGRSASPATYADIREAPAEAVLSFNSENQGGEHQSIEAEYRINSMGIHYPGTMSPFMPSALTIDYNWGTSGPVSGGSTSGSSLMINSSSVRVSDSMNIEDNFPTNVTSSKEIEIPGWYVRNQAVEGTALRVAGGSVRSSAGNFNPATDGHILMQKSVRMNDTNQTVSVRMLRLVINPFSFWNARGGPVINIDPATGARIVASFDSDANIIRVYRYTSWTSRAETIMSGGFSWSGTAEFEITLSRSGNNLTLKANGATIATKNGASNLPNGLYTGISPRSGSFRNFKATDGGQPAGAPGELAPWSVNVNNGRGLNVDGANGAISVAAPGYYHVSMHLKPVDKIGNASGDHFQLYVMASGRAIQISPDISQYQGGTLRLQGSGVAYLDGSVSFYLWSNDASTTRIENAQIQIVRMA